MSRPRTAIGRHQHGGAGAISRPTSTFCTLPPDSRRTGVGAGRDHLQLLHDVLGQSVRAPCGPGNAWPLRQERSIMLSVMPIEPTRPMPSRSSGTKDMATPFAGCPWGPCPQILVVRPWGRIGHGPEAWAQDRRWPPAAPAGRCRRCRPRPGSRRR